MQKDPSLTRQQASDLYFKERIMVKNSSYIVDCSGFAASLYSTISVACVLTAWVFLALADKLAMLIVAAELFGTLLGDVWKSNKVDGSVWEVILKKKSLYIEFL